MGKGMDYFDIHNNFSEIFFKKLLYKKQTLLNVEKY